MRKQNSDFQAGFISEAGKQVENHDYFGYVELDEYACYVIADGITERADAHGAKLAIESIILSFQSNPSMKKSALRKWLWEANRLMCQKDGYKRLKASVAVIVTDYRKIRYAYAGNARIRVYRGGHVFVQTKDMSLSQDMADKEQIPLDEVKRHEERNNLYSYLGQKGFQPFLSKKIKLQETDILTLYTRGIWENIDGAELDDVFAGADNDVENSLDAVEDLLLSKQPKELDNYTFAAIFVNKVYNDPARQKKRKKIILVCVLVTVIVLGILLAVFIFHRIRENRTADMNYHFTNTIEYINTGNYSRAQEECRSAHELAEKLKDASMRSRLQEYMFVIETVIMADESYSGKDYENAREYFLTARDRTRYADNIGSGYIENRLEAIALYLSIADDLELGDDLMELGDYAGAEEKYLSAKKTALSLHDADSKEKAMDALEKLYEKKSEALNEQQQEANEQAGAETSAAELLAGGDKACLEEDFVSAKVYYTLAVSKYEELEDETNRGRAQEKLDAVEQKIKEQQEKEENAKGYENLGAISKECGDYWGAKAQYLLAKNLYQELGKDADVTRVDEIIRQLDALMEMSFMME